MSLKINNLSFSYNKKLILKDINLEFIPGNMYVIAGPNGSGKTTLVKAIMSLVKIDKNSIYLNKKDIHSFSILERSKELGYVAQNFTYDFDFTVYEIVEMGRYSAKNEWNPENDRRAILRALSLTETIEFKDRSINSLSGGELQRVLLARALAGEPKHLILDEPSSNLDISHNMNMMKLIKKLTIELGITTIIVLHDLNMMLRYCDHIILLKDGTIQFHGNINEVLIPKNIDKIFSVNSQIIKDTNGLNHIIIN